MPRMARPLVLLLVLWASPAAGKVKAAPEPRRDWAYPLGLIVTSDGGQVQRFKRDDKGATATGTQTSAGPTTNLTSLAETLVQVLSDCLSQVREGTPALAQGGGKYGLTLSFTISAKGKTESRQ